MTRAHRRTWIVICLAITMCSSLAAASPIDLNLSVNRVNSSLFNYRYAVTNNTSSPISGIDIPAFGVTNIDGLALDPAFEIAFATPAGLLQILMPVESGVPERTGLPAGGRLQFDVLSTYDAAPATIAFQRADGSTDSLSSFTPTGINHAPVLTPVTPTPMTPPDPVAPPGPSILLPPLPTSDADVNVLVTIAIRNGSTLGYRYQLQNRTDSPITRMVIPFSGQTRTMDFDPSGDSGLLLYLGNSTGGMELLLTKDLDVFGVTGLDQQGFLLMDITGSRDGTVAAPIEFDFADGHTARVYSYFPGVTVTETPEPGTLALAALGMLALGFGRWAHRKNGSGSNSRLPGKASLGTSFAR